MRKRFAILLHQLRRGVSLALLAGIGFTTMQAQAATTIVVNSSEDHDQYQS